MSAAGPGVNLVADGVTTAQVEIADAEVGAAGDIERVAQCRKENPLWMYVVEDTRHSGLAYSVAGGSKKPWRCSSY